jgi:hypothetical protein
MSFEATGIQGAYDLAAIAKGRVKRKRARSKYKNTVKI